MTNERKTTPEMRATGARIRQLRLLHGLKQAELAAAVGVGSSGIVSMWERGTRGLTVENKRKVADFFGVTVEDLAGGDTQAAPAAQAPPGGATSVPPGTRAVKLPPNLWRRVERVADAQGIDPATWVADALERPLRLAEIQGRHKARNEDFETYNVEEVAALLDVTVRTVKQLIYAGELNARKIGKRWKVTPENLKAYLHGSSDRTDAVD